MFIIGLDYDSTLFTKSFPEKGEPIQEVFNKAKEFKATGLCEIALWTCREGDSLEEAILRCKENGLEFDSINENTPSEVNYQKEQRKKGHIFATRKIYADIYVDDKSPGSIEYFLNIDVKKTVENFKDR